MYKIKYMCMRPCVYVLASITMKIYRLRYGHWNKQCSSYHVHKTNVHSLRTSHEIRSKHYWLFDFYCSVFFVNIHVVSARYHSTHTHALYVSLNTSISIQWIFSSMKINLFRLKCVPVNTNPISICEIDF